MSLGTTDNPVPPTLLEVLKAWVPSAAIFESPPLKRQQMKITITNAFYDYCEYILNTGTANNDVMDDYQGLSKSTIKKKSFSAATQYMLVASPVTSEKLAYYKRGGSL